ncbi:MAG: LacI family transcriptional regulator [Chloroflexi bacterium]|nr:MAG: LacI family transcriptional regulator [Chloroflexota bacterium]
MSGNRRPTQNDIARLAGVSQATVSQVLNNAMTGSIPEETRRRVLDVIEQLGYVPDRAARSLRTNKTYTLAAVIPDITNPYYPTFIRGVQDTAESQGYDLVIYNTDGELQKEKKCLQLVRQSKVDGLIAVMFHLTAEHMAELGVPVVHFQLKPETPPPVDIVYIDNAGAARELVNHLIERNDGCIGMIAGEEDTPPRLGRICGYSQALAEHHIPLEEILIRGGQYNQAGGYQGMCELLSLERRPCAVFAANDLMAMGALVAAREAGLRVPEDIAIAGFDDIPAAALVDPPLTTVTQFQDQIGKRAAEMLFERIHGTAPEEMRAVEMPYRLIIRKSA